MLRGKLGAEETVMNETIVYTDGSCLRNPGPGGWGCRIIYPDETVQELGAAEPNTTNNRMEMQAVIAALTHLGTPDKLRVYTDSRYVLDGLTKWLPAWQRRGWITSTGQPVKNRDLWQHLSRLMYRGIRWHHVQAHRGDPNNERVDDIARGFARGSPPTLFHGRLGDPDDPVKMPVEPLAPADAPLPRRTRGSGAPRYVSIVNGVVAVDADWPACAARVQGVSRARYKKVRTRQEMAAFCAEHGVEVPPDF
jgi:ribonuclease HI